MPTRALTWECKLCKTRVKTLPKFKLGECAKRKRKGHDFRLIR